jgi:tRNA-Thr(GGU) m(6)t(6)A37 methyltransferase TsaA
MTISRRELISAGAGLAACSTITATGQEDYMDTVYKLYPIGVVHNKKGKPVTLEIYEKYVPALHRLDLCSHVMVLWWFHKNDTPEKRRILKVHPRGNRKNPLTGVFATHSPVRPNLIAVTNCKILSVEKGIVTIDKIDAFDNTPILDLKSAGTRKESLKR